LTLSRRGPSPSPRCHHADDAGPCRRVFVCRRALGLGGGFGDAPDDDPPAAALLAHPCRRRAHAGDVPAQVHVDYRVRSPLPSIFHIPCRASTPALGHHDVEAAEVCHGRDPRRPRFPALPLCGRPRRRHRRPPASRFALAAASPPPPSTFLRTTAAPCLGERSRVAEPEARARAGDPAVLPVRSTPPPVRLQYPCVSTFLSHLRVAATLVHSRRRQRSAIRGRPARSGTTVVPWRPIVGTAPPPQP